MTIHIQIAQGFEKGKWNILVGDIKGSCESSNISKEELLEEVREQLTIEEDLEKSDVSSTQDVPTNIVSPEAKMTEEEWYDQGYQDGKKNIEDRQDTPCKNCGQSIEKHFVRLQKEGAKIDWCYDGKGKYMPDVKQDKSEQGDKND